MSVLKESFVVSNVNSFGFLQIKKFLTITVVMVLLYL